ncbi:MAG: DUF3887 domain-containing protein [Armatimonadota bacterium]|nr:DUF3887 domain-containing protein [bacterium]
MIPIDRLRKYVILIVILVMGTQIVRYIQEGTYKSYCNRAMSVVSLIKSGDYQSLRPYLNSTMIAECSKFASGQLWQQMCGRYGTFVSFGSPTQKTKGPIVVVTVPCQFAFAKVDAQVYFDEAKSVCGFFYFKRSENGTSIPVGKRASIEIKRAKEAITALARHDNECFSKLLCLEMASAFDPPAQQTLWRNIEKRYGRFRGVIRSTRSTMKDLDSVCSTCRFTSGDIAIVMKFNIGGQICGLSLQNSPH